MAIMFLNIRKVSLASVGGGGAIVDYYSRDEAVDTSQLDETDVNDMLGYYSRFDDEELSTGFGAQGDKSASQSKAEFELYNPEEVLQSVISFREHDALNLGFIDKADFARLADIYVRECALQSDIKMENLIWTGYLHRNTNNPHMHIYFFDKSKKQQSLFSKKELKAVRSRLANSILSQQDLYMQKEEKRKDLLIEVKMLLNEKTIENHIQARMFEGLSMRKMSAEDKSLVRLLQQCAFEIPREGRTQMKVLKKFYPEAYRAVTKVVDELIKRSPSFNEYQEELNKIEENFVSLYGTHSEANDYQQNQMDDLYRHIGNVVIKTVKSNRSDLMELNFENARLSETLFSLSKSCFGLMASSLSSLTGGLGHNGSSRERRREDEELAYEV